jgi:integrase
MRLYKRGPLWWARWTENGRTVRRTTGARDRKAAQRTIDRWQRERADPQYHAAHQATVRSAAERFIRELVDEHLRAGTLNMYACKASHVVRLLGDVRLVALEHERVKQFVHEREAEGAHSHTIHRELTTLRRILRSASKAREFPREPRSVIPKFSAGYVPRTRYLSCFELYAVLDVLPPYRGAWLAFIVATSARLGEAMRAQRGDIGRESIQLRGTKTAGALRRVPVVTMLRPLVERVLRDADGNAPMLLRPWLNMRRDIAIACKRVGCAPFTPNDLRRTTGTWLLQLGVPIDVVAKVLGHASPSMLYKVYGQLGAEDLGRLIQSRLL